MEHVIKLGTAVFHNVGPYNKSGMNGRAFQARLAKNKPEGNVNRMIFIARLAQARRG